MSRSIVGIPMHKKFIKLKSNKPIVPQLSEPIKTSKKDNLSNMFNLHILFNFLSVKWYLYIICIKNTIITKS